MEEKFKLDRQTMALRVAREFQDGDVINLGAGIPVLAANYIPAGREVLFQGENGVLGFGDMTPPGEGDFDLVSPGGQTVYERPGMSCFDHAESFTMIRGGHIDISVLGGFQVSQKGDLANWMVPERQIGTVGGAMDLAVGVKKLIVVMNHTTKNGEPRVLQQCTYPLTAIECVDLLVTDVAVIEIKDKKMTLKEVAPGWTPEEVQAVTGAALTVSPDLQEIALM